MFKRSLDLFANACKAFVLPMLQRPHRLQAAALCYRRKQGRTQVLLITSLGTGRWIVPKGWLMRGKNASEAAVVEAWEEAGVLAGRTAAQPSGSFVYDKIKGSGLPVSVEVLVYPVEVRRLAADFPEAGRRRLCWVEPDRAAEMVTEPGLKRILRHFGQDPKPA